MCSGAFGINSVQSYCLVVPEKYVIFFSSVQSHPVKAGGPFGEGWDKEQQRGFLAVLQAKGCMILAELEQNCLAPARCTSTGRYGEEFAYFCTNHCLSENVLNLYALKKKQFYEI